MFLKTTYIKDLYKWPKYEFRNTTKAKWYFVKKWNLLPFAILQMILPQESSFMEEYGNFDTVNMKLINLIFVFL